MATLKVWNGTVMVPMRAFGLLAVTTTNVGNAYSVTIPSATYTDGEQISVKFNAASTGAITINVNSLGAKAVIDYFGNAVTNVRANLMANLAYDATSGNFILQGKGGGGSATPVQLLAGATATTDAGQITGTMPNKGAVTITPSASSQAIPAGYHNGSGSVPAVSVPAANVLTGTTIAGTAGTMANNGAYNITPSDSTQSIPAGYHNGSGLVSAIAGRKKYATGNATPVSRYITVTGLSFTPRIILWDDGYEGGYYNGSDGWANYWAFLTRDDASHTHYAKSGNVSVSAGSFSAYIYSVSTTTWWAFE